MLRIAPGNDKFMIFASKHPSALREASINLVLKAMFSSVFCSLNTQLSTSLVFLCFQDPSTSIWNTI